MFQMTLCDKHIYLFFFCQKIVTQKKQKKQGISVINPNISRKSKLAVFSQNQTKTAPSS